MRVFVKKKTINFDDENSLYDKKEIRKLIFHKKKLVNFKKNK